MGKQGHGMRINKYRGQSVTLATTLGFAQLTGIPSWANYLTVEAPSATLETITMGLGPPIRAAYFFDASLTEGARYRDLTKELTDKNTATGSVTFLNSMQTDDFIYVGTPRRHRGIGIDVTNTNSTVSTMTAENSNGSGGFTALTITDGTQTGGNTTLGADGVVSHTVPLNWAAIQLDLGSGIRSEKLFWTRYAVSVALDTTVSIVEVVAAANFTVNSLETDAEGYAGILIRSNNDAKRLYEFWIAPGEFGSIDLVSSAITSAALVNCFQVEDKD